VLEEKPDASLGEWRIRVGTSKNVAGSQDLRVPGEISQQGVKARLGESFKSQITNSRFRDRCLKKGRRMETVIRVNSPGST
jgi:hypothetical protein